jgi:hypothetical protein
MGLMDRVKGIQRPDADVAPRSREELQRDLMALNGDEIPFVVAPGGHADVEAHWEIVDARWYEVFAKAGLEKTHTIHLAFDEERHEVRMLEETWEVSWSAGVPNLQVSVDKFRGRTMGSKQFGTAYAFTGPDPLHPQEVYNYRFDVSEMKKPIGSVVTAAGWTLVPVTTKRGLLG